MKKLYPVKESEEKRKKINIKKMHEKRRKDKTLNK